MSRTIMDRLDTLAAALEDVRFLAGIDGVDRYKDLVRRCRLLIDAKLRFESGAENRAPLILVVAGGTNVGKSSLVTWLAGEGAAAVTHTARGTRTPLATGDACAMESAAKRWNRTGTTIKTVSDVREALEDFTEPVILLREHPAFPLANTILIDSPDFDSNHLVNHATSEWMIALSDAVIVVVTPEKYNDEAVANQITRTRAMGRKIIAVFNKMDGEDAVLDDFRSMSLRDGDGLVVFHRYNGDRRPDRNAVLQLQTRIFNETKNEASLKRSAIRASLDELEQNMKTISERLRDEERWLREPAHALDIAVDAVVDRYADDVAATEKFIELDHVIRVLLQRFDVPGIDTATKALRKRLKPLVELIRRQFGWMPGDASLESTRRRQREIQRLTIARNDIESYVLARFVEESPEMIRTTVAEWVDDWRQSAPQADLEEWNRTIEARVREWVRVEADAIAERLRSHPYGYEVLKYGKMLIQIGFGIIGAVVTGGWGLTDIVVLPLTERLAHLLINLGLDRVYFVGKRKQLIQDRRMWLKGLLLERLDPLVRKLQVPTGTDCRMLDALVATLPEAKEICR